MSAEQEVRTMMEHVFSAAAKGDFVPFASALDEDLEVFDHVACRFDTRDSFLAYLQSAMGRAESTTFDVHQPSYRVFGDAAVVNTYDRVATVPKGGGPAQVQCGRTTLVYVKRGTNWKIVSAHFSPMPKE